jgi:predicted pyridoxine 5'-phosphate oxidase superfamily flavin-nucleotide-binding protein
MTRKLHEGECAMHELLGVAEQVEPMLDRMLRDFMPDQHRDFYARLPFLVVGSLDDRGRPWASLIAGEPGFVSTPDNRTISVRAQPLPGDPLGQNLVPGAAVGCLGIELPTRRRNRANGRITGVHAHGFDVAVDIAFGNCPKYIQARAIQLAPAPAQAGAPGAPGASDRLDAARTTLVEQADTFFIASRHADDDRDPRHGVDVSHRGGRPGFVSVREGKQLVFPDFAGNFHFATLGNVLVDPRVGLLFLGFEQRDLLWITGRAQIVWVGPELEQFQGAERLIAVDIDEARWSEGALPLASGPPELSPLHQHTGTWPRAGG